ncbi:HNH endonuclease signature motif containing protein [Rhodococcus pyridinivorans]|uniref:HNH endonuclease n=1 Tax=Rhodococcus pyridinivorans TaxID=103816 RepID=UPI00280C2A56|nr:HNH endonuclease signature motif containing protein [Rhodococcus pyridinivorans]WMM73018.1 HNH endonuclease signature motif containing protein [Rhodococcus pyridinivorans]
MSRAWAGGSTRQWRNQRQRALDRDGHRCVDCTAPAVEVDHIVGRGDGGTDDLENLRSLCVRCHDRYTRAQTRRARGGRRPREQHPGLI